MSQAGRKHGFGGYRRARRLVGVRTEGLSRVSGRATVHLAHGEYERGLAGGGRVGWCWVLGVG